MTGPSAVKITLATVFDKLQSFKSDKSPGPDGWPPTILKNCVKQLCVLLAILFNKFLKSGLLSKDAHYTIFFKKEVNSKLTTIIQCV